ncbi:MAG: c-type cytochrome [Oceanicoccus sp.]
MKRLFGFKHILVGCLAISATWFTYADLEQGEGLYSSCIWCHGMNGEGVLGMGPALAGQTDVYLSRQLNHFKAGIRASEVDDFFGGQMRAMSMTLVDEQAVASVSAYIASLPVSAVTSANAVAGDIDNGKMIYQGSCSSCHGATAEGNPLVNAPRLVSLDATYLARQLSGFKTGLRGSHEDDVYGGQMKFMAKSIHSDQDLNDVVAYIWSLAK